MGHIQPVMGLKAIKLSRIIHKNAVAGFVIGDDTVKCIKQARSARHFGSVKHDVRPVRSPKTALGIGGNKGGDNAVSCVVGRVTQTVKPGQLDPSLAFSKQAA